MLCLCALNNSPAVTLCHLIGDRLQNVHPAVVESFTIYSFWFLFFCFTLFLLAFLLLHTRAPDDREVEDFFERKRKPSHSKDALVWFRFYMYMFVHSLKSFFLLLFPFPSTRLVSLPFNFLLYGLF